MRLSTKSRFAVNAIIDLALRDGAGPVALASIAARQGISLSYLEQLFARLRRQAIVDSTRGPGGGYTLARTAEQISVADIVSAIDDLPVAAQTDTARELWADLDAAMLRHMATISLRSLVDNALAKGAVVEAQPTRRVIASDPVLRPVTTNAPNSVFALGRSLAGQ